MVPRIIYSNGEQIEWDGPMYDPFPDKETKDKKKKKKKKKEDKKKEEDKKKKEDKEKDLWS